MNREWTRIDANLNDVNEREGSRPAAAGSVGSSLGLQQAAPPLQACRDVQSHLLKFASIRVHSRFICVYLRSSAVGLRSCPFAVNYVNRSLRNCRNVAGSGILNRAWVGPGPTLIVIRRGRVSSNMLSSVRSSPAQTAIR
jgi:hypothetical protein